MLPLLISVSLTNSITQVLVSQVLKYILNIPILLLLTSWGAFEHLNFIPPKKLITNTNQKNNKRTPHTFSSHTDLKDGQTWIQRVSSHFTTARESMRSDRSTAPGPLGGLWPPDWPSPWPCENVPHSPGYGGATHPISPPALKQILGQRDPKHRSRSLVNFGPSGMLSPSQALLSTQPLPGTPFTPAGPGLLTAWKLRDC